MKNKQTSFCLLLPVILLTGCTISGGVFAHDPSFDDAYRGDNLVGEISLIKEVNNNLELVFRHQSMLTNNNSQYHKAENGYNGIGAVIKYEIK